MLNAHLQKNVENIFEVQTRQPSRLDPTVNQIVSTHHGQPTPEKIFIPTAYLEGGIILLEPNRLGSHHTKGTSMKTGTILCIHMQRERGK
jgi:hypothetical protein